uniref:Uncharacterized protein n=1 Tax=Megalopteran tombus-related virus TaxID=2822556 RepID=A0A8A6RIM4_9TOMB|nr:hypothetical protein [Megalopteran tombus-related virus]
MERLLRWLFPRPPALNPNPNRERLIGQIPAEAPQQDQQGPPLDAEQQINAIHAQRRLDEVTREQNTQNCVDFLYTKTYGKVIDKNYQTYCAALLNEYLDQNHILNITTRRRLMNDTIRIHIDEKLREEPIYNANTIQRINEYNQEVRGNIIEPYYFIFTRQVKIDEDLNLQRPHCLRAYSNESRLLMGLLALGLAYMVGKSIISPLLQNLTNSITIPTLQKQLMPPIQTDINQGFSLNMSQDSFNSCIDTLRNSFATHADTHVENIVIPWYSQLADKCTTGIVTIWNRVVG